MTGPRQYLTVAEAALFTGKTERTIRRWMSGRLLAIYVRGDGKTVLAVTELTRVEREQRRRTGARERRRDAMLAELNLVSYPPGIGRRVPDES